MDEIKRRNINKWLDLKYGRSLDNRAKYRLVWSTSMTEVRHGIFLDWSQFVGYYEVEDTRECPKYNYAEDRWVLEKLTSTANMPADLVSAKPVDYEVLWIFWKGDDGEYVEPTEEAIDRLVYFDINKTLKGHVPTETELKKMDNEARDKRRAAIREKLDDAVPELAHALVHGSAVTVGEVKSGKESVS